MVAVFLLLEICLQETAIFIVYAQNPIDHSAGKSSIERIKLSQILWSNNMEPRKKNQK